MIQLRFFSSSHDEELKISVKKNINPKKLRIKISKIFERLETLTSDLYVQNVAMYTWFIKNFCFAPPPL